MNEFISNSGTLINPDSVYDQERFINILQIILQKKTQKELSEQTGLNNATISRMLNGARSGRPYKSTIDKIAKAIVCNYLFSFPYFFRRISRSDNRKSLMNSEYLFTKLTGKNKGEPLDADSVYSMLKRLSKQTDINSHPHQLRHYFAEERRKEGWDLNDIRFALGHKKVETTIKYLGENNERLIEATDQYYSNNEDLYQIADFL